MAARQAKAPKVTTAITILSILILCFLFCFAPQSETSGGGIRSTNRKEKRLRPEDAVKVPPPALRKLLPQVDDLLQNGEVGFKGLPSSPGQLIVGLGTSLSPQFPGIHVSRLPEGPEVCDEIAVAHLQAGLEVLEGPGLSPRDQQGDNPEPALLVDDPVELGKINHAIAESRVSDALRIPRLPILRLPPCWPSSQSPRK